jgi:uncharacterized membrane protein YbhN (UPF0104 family)
VRQIPWVRIGVSAVAMGLLFWRVPADTLWLALRNFDVQELLPALSCVAAVLAVRAYKWHLLLGEGSVQAHSRDSFRSLCGGFALSIITPGRLGELGRCFFAVESERPRVLLLTVLDRALDFWALLTWTVLSLFLVLPRPPAIFAVGVWLAFLPVVMGLPTLISNLSTMPRWSARARGQIAAAAQSLKGVRTPRLAALSFAATALDLMLFFFLLRGFCTISFAVALATFPWIVMAGGFPASVGGFGLREGVAILLLTRYALPPAAALEAAMLLFAFGGLLPAILGAIWLLADWRKLKTGWLEGLETLLGRA